MFTSDYLQTLAVDGINDGMETAESVSAEAPVQSTKPNVDAICEQAWKALKKDRKGAYVAITFYNDGMTISDRKGWPYARVHGGPYENVRELAKEFVEKFKSLGAGTIKAGRFNTNLFD